MKKIVLTLMSTCLAACSSLNPKTEELQQSPICKVWKEEALGGKKVIDVEGEVAKQKQTCWVLNSLLCSYTDYTFNGFSTEIRSSLPPEDKAIAHLEGNRITKISMAGITVDSIELNESRADYEIQGPFGPKQKMAVEYNSRCTKRQAALGLMAMLAQ